jgi:hypothetical protein
MRIGLPVVLLGLVAASPTLASGVSSLAEAQQLAARENKPVLVDFFAVW